MPDNKNDDIFEFMMKKAFEKYAEDIADEPVPELSEEAQAYMEESKQRVYKNVMKQVRRDERKAKPKSVKKLIYLVAIISVIGILFAANATAFKSFIYKTYTTVEGNVMKISTDYADFERQYDEITEFEHKDELIIPGWLPNEAQLVKVQDSDTYVVLRYEIGDNILDITEADINFQNNYSEEQLESNKYKGKTVNILGMKAKILKRVYESDAKGTSVVWGSDKVKYTINTDLSYTALMSIIKELKYHQ